MKLFKAALFGALLWVLIFMEISIFKVGLKIQPPTQLIIHYVLLIPMVVLCAYLYYKSNDKINGFVLGILFLLTGTILDLVITIPLFINYDYVGFYSDIYMIMGFAESIIVTGVYDLIRKK